MRQLRLEFKTMVILAISLVFFSGCVCQIALGGKDLKQGAYASGAEKTIQDALDALQKIELLLAQKDSLDKSDIEEIKKLITAFREMTNNNNLTVVSTKPQK